MGLAVEIGRIGGMGERGCSRVDREYRKCWSEGYCRRDRENREGERGCSRVDREDREMSRRVFAGFGHISLNLVVHAKA